jgi:ribosome-binding factor A
MPRDFSRTQRVAEQMQRELSILLQREMRDPRVEGVSISGVDVTRDFSVAKIYFSMLNNPDGHKNALTALEKAAGFLRHALGQSMQLRVIPELRFIYDESLVRGTSLSELIDKVVADDNQKHVDED